MKKVCIKYVLNEKEYHFYFIIIIKWVDRLDRLVNNNYYKVCNRACCSQHALNKL